MEEKRKRGRPRKTEEEKAVTIKIKKAGRPTKLSEELKAKLFQGIKTGLPYINAAHVAGISEKTFYAWKNRGEAEEAGVYATFLQELKEAESFGMAVLLQKIHKAGMPGEIKKFIEEEYDANGKIVKTYTRERQLSPAPFAPHAWILERRHPNEFGRNRVVNTEDQKVLPWSDNPLCDIPDPLMDTDN